jgi:methionine sulfoxide reductase catalytic subunit
MPIHRKPTWLLPEQNATPESVFHSRREILAGMGLGGMSLAFPNSAALAQQADPAAHLFPAKRNEKFALGDRALTEERVNLAYNNFYEYGETKSIANAAQQLKTRPWTIQIEGLVEKPMTLDVDDLFKRVSFEERLYRHRCVEAWSMTVPWTGFPMRALLEIAKPLSSAKYVRFDTFLDPQMAPNQRRRIYPWPYLEGLTMAEAAHDLTFMVTGAYGKPLAKQFGAPIRISVPWKYGVKHVKSINRIAFVDKRPKGFWESLQPAEYGFWANVNPAVSHPRWSQATEEVLGTAGKRIPTLIFNGYGEEVAGLYKGLEHERLWA